MTLTSYEIAEVIEGRNHDGKFVAIVTLTNGEKRGLLLGPEQLDDLSHLLREAQAQRRSPPAQVESSQYPTAGSQLDPDLPAQVAVARIEVRSPVDPKSPSQHGIFEIRLEGQDGRGVSLRLPHEEVISWRDTLSEQIEKFQRHKTN